MTLFEVLAELRPSSAPVALGTTGFHSFLERIKPFIPLVLMYPIFRIMKMKRFFGDTWRELDIEAQEARGKMLAEGKFDSRPMVALVMCAMILTLQDYYGGRGWFELSVRPLLAQVDEAHPTWLKLFKYSELWAFAWWAGTRIGGYMLPLALWKIFFREDSILDFGLRTRGLTKHLWLYGIFLVVIIPTLFIVARSPDFATYYPFYKGSSRSWFDFLVWEAMYFAQFFALEVFFRGFWVRALAKSFGSGAIFAMAVPYCMIHYGKPYLEACGAIIAGVALGSLSMKTKSIYLGFLLHITVALLMDWLALGQRGALPTVLFAP